MFTYCYSDECSELKKQLDEKTKGLELLTSENHELKRQLEETSKKAKDAEAENKMLVDRWMLQKMQDAERLNEVLYILTLAARGIKLIFSFQVEFLLFSSVFSFSHDPVFVSV